jgi:hypothetical protein
MDRIKHDRKKTAFKKDPTLLLKSRLRFLEAARLQSAAPRQETAIALHR